MPVQKWSDTVIVAHLADDPQFREDLLSVQQLIDTGIRDVVLDFAAIGFLSSSNLANLLHLRKLMNAAARRLVLCSIPTAIWGTFLVTSLDQVFNFSDNVTTALATLQIA